MLLRDLKRGDRIAIETKGGIVRHEVAGAFDDAVKLSHPQQYMRQWLVLVDGAFFMRTDWRSGEAMIPQDKYIPGEDGKMGTFVAQPYIRPDVSQPPPRGTNASGEPSAEQPVLRVSVEPRHYNLWLEAADA